MMLQKRIGLRRRQYGETGDTLIEVLFAFAVLSMVIVGALTIMNQGTIASQRSLETTLVRQEIDGQATTLRFMHDAYVANFKPGVAIAATSPAGQWKAMTDSIHATSASSISNLTSCPATAPSGSFILDPSTATFKTVDTAIVHSKTYAQIAYGTDGKFTQSEGIWIEGVRSGATGDANQDNTRYIDFHIVACWDAPGNGPPSTIATIVRLYEPRS